MMCDLCARPAPSPLASLESLDNTPSLVSQKTELHADRRRADKSGGSSLHGQRCDLCGGRRRPMLINAGRTRVGRPAVNPGGRAYHVLLPSLDRLAAKQMPRWEVALGLGRVMPRISRPPRSNPTLANTPLLWPFPISNSISRAGTETWGSQ